MKNKEIFIVAVFVLVSLFIYAIFPTNNNFQQITTALIFFVSFPIILNHFFLKRKPEFYGLSFGNWKSGLLWSFFSLVVISFIFLIYSYYFGFLKNYSVPVFILNNFWNFMFYEFIVVFLFVLMYEFYFRGFILFVFESRFKYWAILIQALIFLVLALSIRDVSLYLLMPYLFFSPFAGLIAIKSKSIIYSLCSQFLIIFFLDFLVLRMIS